MMTSSGPWPGINSCGRYMIGFEPPLWDDQLFSASHHSLFQGMPSLRRAEQGSRSRAAGGPPPKAGDIPLDGLSRPSTLAAALVDRPSRSENHATFRKLLNLLPNLPRSLGNSANLVLRISAGAKKTMCRQGLGQLWRHSFILLSNRGFPPSSPSVSWNALPYATRISWRSVATRWLPVEF